MYHLRVVRSWMLIALVFACACEGAGKPAPGAGPSSSAPTAVMAEAPPAASPQGVPTHGGVSASASASAVAGAPVEAWAVVATACRSGTFVSNGQSVVMGEPVHQYLRFHPDGVAIAQSILAVRTPGSPPPAIFHRDNGTSRHMTYRTEGAQLRFVYGTMDYVLDLQRPPYRAVTTPVAGGAKSVELYACIP